MTSIAPSYIVSFQRSTSGSLINRPVSAADLLLSRLEVIQDATEEKLSTMHAVTQEQLAFTQEQLSVAQEQNCTIQVETVEERQRWKR